MDLLIPYSLHNRKRSLSTCSILILPLFFLCTTDIWWFQSSRVEVYTLNALLSALVVYLLLDSTLSLKKQICIFFLLGSGLANHTLLFIHIFPGCLIYLFIQNIKRFKNPAYITTAIVFGLLGLTVYLYLPLRSSLNPVPDLGDPETYSGFMLSFFRKRSFGKFFGNNPAQFLESFRIFLPRYFNQFTPVAVLFILTGFFYLLKYKFKQTLLLVIIICVNIAFGLMNRNFIDNPDTMDAYFLNTYQFSTVFLGSGLMLILNQIKNLARTLHSRNIYCLRYFLVVITLSIPFVFWIHRYPENVLRNDEFPRKFGKTILNLASPDAVVFTGYYTNTHFILMELVYVEKYREDIAIIDRSAILHWHRYENYIKDRYPNLNYPLLFLQRPENSNPAGYLLDALQNRETLEKILKEYTSLLVESNLTDHPTFWMSSEDDYLFYHRLVPRGPIFQISQQQSDSISEFDNNIDSKIYHRMENEYLHDPNFLKNMIAKNILASQFGKMSISFYNSGFKTWAETELLRANQIYLLPH
ncbi:MAG: hypothetical protein A2161_22190 [Candidatus Schekmanbacteria bacterium RBG_13_48_7]|uniref:DUF2723 domain-containing protein n=1 Tax=Candidatus Schekmanbacteria bacterium RBG_13_48_7 TaxID=1817878 RepID=A0A1F7RYC5_9BACT|nr:MAG: hypothetical protein A2161_22190 [Candidatus Schekmanbacteria bacterium RBG_13_48_7]